MDTTTIDGATVGWTDTGAGAATLLIHAGGFEAWFGPLADRLPLRVIRMVRTGYGGLPSPPRLITVAEHAAHAAAVLERLDAAPATVIGHSSGSAIALQLALDRPDLVAGLVLSEPPLVDPLLDPADVAPVGAALGPVLGAARAAAARGDNRTALDAFLTAVCGPGHRAVLPGVLGADGLDRAERYATFFFANEVPAIGSWTVGDLGRVTACVLLVQGGASPAATHRVVARLAAALPTAEAATIAGANHLLPLTHPGELADLVSAWSDQALRPVGR